MDYSGLIFKAFNISQAQTKSAEYKKLLQKVDGNIDSNRDGVKDEKDKNGAIDAAELYEEVFNNRYKYSVQLQQLYKAGFEDPFEKRDEVKGYVANLLKNYKPTSEVDKAILLMRSMLHPDLKFLFNGMEYPGLTQKEGGLEVWYSNHPDEEERIMYGDLLPKEIIATQPGNRIALCLEYSHLLAVLLREAGINAGTKIYYDHANVIAYMNNRKYVMDPSMLLMDETGETQNSDRESISAHYCNEGVNDCLNGYPAKAIEALDTAIELDPYSARAWANKSIAMAKFPKLSSGELKQACRTVDRAVELDPNDPKIQRTKKILTVLYLMAGLDEIHGILDMSNSKISELIDKLEFIR